MSDVKREALQLIDALSDEASWRDVLGTLNAARFRDAVRTGADAADRGDVATRERIRKMFAKSGVDVPV